MKDQDDMISSPLKFESSRSQENISKRGKVLISHRSNIDKKDKINVTPRLMNKSKIIFQKRYKRSDFMKIIEKDLKTPGMRFWNSLEKTSGKKSQRFSRNSKNRIHKLVTGTLHKSLAKNTSYYGNPNSEGKINKSKLSFLKFLIPKLICLEKWIVPNTLWGNIDFLEEIYKRKFKPKIHKPETPEDPEEESDQPQDPEIIKRKNYIQFEYQQR